LKRPNKLNKLFDWNQFTLASVCILACCVSLGTATVSLAKALVLACFLLQISLNYRKFIEFKLSPVPLVFIWMIFALIWMLMTMSWSHATDREQWQYLYGHTRFLWIGVIYFLLRTKDRALTALKWLIYGQIFVVTLSWLMWLGLEIPFTRRPIEKGIAFTSTLEQPVMTVLALIALWVFREFWKKLWGTWFVRIAFAAMAINIVFVMSGRTGYFVFLLFITIEIFRLLPTRWRWLAVLAPAILSVIFYAVSPVFSKRIGEVERNSQAFLQNEALSSEGERLDMWKHTLSAILKKPILGYGVGSMPRVYKEEGGLIRVTVSQPHQQYLFWWAEFGFVGLVIMLGFFFALIKDSRLLEPEAKSSLISVIAVLFTMGLFNCPFFGAGMGDFFFLQIAALLVIKGGASSCRAPNNSRQSY
jgi:O-antigen ligase